MSDVKRKVRQLEKELAGDPSVGYCQHMPITWLWYRDGEEPPETPALCEECGLPIETVVEIHLSVVTVDDVRRR